MNEYEIVPVGSIDTHPENARRGNIAEIADSIRAHGFYGSLVVQKSTNRIIVGNHRYRAAVDAGLDAVPVVFVDVDDDEARRIMLVDNRSTDRASYDDSRLLELLGELPSLDGTGYDDDDLDDLMALVDESPIPTVPTPSGGDPDGKHAGTPGEGAWLQPTFDDKKDEYMNRSTRSIILTFTLDEYDEIVGGLTALRSAMSIESNAEVLRVLVAERVAKS